MQDLLAPFEIADYRFLTDLLAGPLGRADDTATRAALARYEREHTPAARADLDDRLERTLRYLGSSDLAYAAREAAGQTPGVTLDELTGDAARALGITVPAHLPLRERIEAVVEAHAARTFAGLEPADQQRMLEELGVESQQAKRFLKTSAGVFAFPALVTAFETLVVEGLVKRLIFGTIAKFVGRRLSGVLFGALATRMPWWLRVIGPAAWTLSLGWTLVDLQGPALRKTVPAVLYLGLVSLRARLGAAGRLGPDQTPLAAPPRTSSSATG